MIASSKTSSPSRVKSLRMSLTPCGSPASMEAFPKAEQAVHRALALNPNLAEAHTSLGLVRFQYSWDWEGAEQELKKAIDINPNYALTPPFFAASLKARER